MKSPFQPWEVGSICASNNPKRSKIKIEFKLALPAFSGGTNCQKSFTPSPLGVKNFGNPSTVKSCSTVSWVIPHPFLSLTKTVTAPGATPLKTLLDAIFEDRVVLTYDDGKEMELR